MKPFWKEKWFIPLLWLILIHWIGLLYTPDLSLGLKLAKKTHYWLLAFVLTSLPFFRFNTENFIKAYLTGLTAGSLYLLFIVLFSPKLIYKLYKMHITFALLLVLGILILSYYFLRTKKWYFRGIIIFLFFIFLSILILSRGKTGYVTLIASFPIIFYNIFRKNYFKIILITMLSIIVFISLPPVKKIIKLAITYESKRMKRYVGTFGERIYMLKVTMNIFKKCPILGGGTGSFPKYAEKFKPKKTLPNFSQPHNSYLYLLGSFGILGLIPFLWLLYLMFKTGIKHYHNPIGFFIFAFTLVFSIGSLGDSIIISHATCILFGLTIGLQSFFKK
ncbi:MAG: O-antigen ligase family protein [Candidatus Desulfofervidus auxilii]|nr:O-antigen ligase family protein [Candidatus Desulfofervidus auxilii]